MWTETDVLYALFILKANSFAYETYTKLYQDDIESYMYFMNFHYADLFADRAIAEIEYSGHVADHFKKAVTGKFSQGQDCLGMVCRWSGGDEKHKIKFRFVEDE